VLSDVVNIIVGWIGIIVSLKSRVWHVLFILCPGNSRRFKEIDNGGDRERDTAKIIVPNAKIVTADDSYVIRL
jgi:hypothetical protein